jgi:hypothetical protein
MKPFSGPRKTASNLSDSIHCQLSLYALAVVAVSVLVLAPTALASSTWYVDGVNGSDSNNCKTRLHACKTIGHAISLVSSGDTIGVGPATYTENLTIGFSLKLIGSGAKTTIIDGGRKGTVIGILSAGVRVKLASLTIRGGSGGGGSGGGVSNDGTLNIINCTITRNNSRVGGGVYNGGTLRISDTTISGNGAFISGGGIANGGTLELVNSTIEGNVASGWVVSGGHFRGPSGGGIDNFGTSTISNTTIANNAAIFAPPVGPCHIFGPCYVSGMDIAGPTTIENSIVAKGVYPDGLNCSGAVNSKGYNLSSDNTCNFNGPGDLNITDPKFGTLGNYGGPTQTIPLLSGSPAIDSGNPNGCTDGRGHLLTTDQRGKPRPDKEDSGGCDMGAYERQSD